MAYARTIVKLIGSTIVLAVAITLAVPALTGHPVLTYASSGSMEPTIGTLDGFLVDPYPSSLGEGDVIVYDSITHGGPAVHRIVGGSPDGWITRGDANAAPDQDGGEPLVTSARVLGKVVTHADGRPILFKGLGVTYLEARGQFLYQAQRVGGVQQLAALGFLALAIAFAVPAFFSKPALRRPTRMSPRMGAWLRRKLPRGIQGRHLGALLVLALVLSTAYAATHARQDVATTIVVVTDPSSADPVRAAPPGHELPRDIMVGSLGYLPTVIVMEPSSSALRIDERSVFVGAHGTRNVTIHERAADDPGLQEDAVHVWRYPAFFPAPVLVALHDTMPGLPFVVLSALILGVGYAWYAALGLSRLPIAPLLGIKEDWL